MCSPEVKKRAQKIIVSKGLYEKNHWAILREEGIIYQIIDIEKIIGIYGKIGALVKDNEGKFRIIVDEQYRHNEEKQKEIIAHELGHYFLDGPTMPNGSIKRDTETNLSLWNDAESDKPEPEKNADYCWDLLREIWKLWL